MKQETLTDMRTFEDLYNDLIDRYDKLGIESDDAFEFIGEYSWLGRFVNNQLKWEFYGDRRPFIDAGLECLCKFEKLVVNAEKGFIR